MREKVDRKPCKPVALLAELNNHSQVTIPHRIIEAFDLKDGDKLQFDIVDGKICITPVLIVPRDEAWLWTEDVQSAVKEADQNYRAGQLKSWNSVDEMFEDLGLIKDED